MTDWTKTIVVGVSAIDGAPPTLWGAMTWGTDLWGSNDIVNDYDVTHLTDLGSEAASSDMARFDVTNLVAIGDEPATSDQVRWEVTHLVSDLADITMVPSYIKSFSLTISEAITASFSEVSEYLTDPAGYDFVFPGDGTNASSRALTSWADVAEDTEAYTEPPAPATAWVEV